jgi:hypothetical protein
MGWWLNNELERKLTLCLSLISTTNPAIRSRDRAVGIATGYGLDDRGVGVRHPVDSRIFSSPRRPDLLWGPPNLLSNEYPGGKSAGAETHHSPPTSAEVKKTWIYTSNPPYAFMA